MKELIRLEYNLPQGSSAVRPTNGLYHLFFLPLTKSMLARDCYDLLLINFSICLFVFFFRIDHPCGQKKRRASVAQVVVVETI